MQSDTEVVRTGARAAALAEILERSGMRRLQHPPARSPRISDLSRESAALLITLFESFGGHRSDLHRLRPGGWDLSFESGLIVELDEELHFNRYRLATLDHSWATTLPWRGTYLRYCVTFEPECLRAATWGKRWTNSSCERLFGPAGRPGDLDAAGGAPRWKQRALYDAMKDRFALERPNVSLARLSTHDMVGDQALESMLRSPADADVRQVASLVEARTI